MWSAAQPVATQSGVTADSISTAMLNSTKPLHLPDFAAHWPAVCAAKQGETAIRDYLLSHYSGEPLTAYISDAQSSGRVFYNADFSGFNFQPVHAKLDQLLASPDDGAHWYVGATFVPRWFPQWLQQQHVPALAQQADNPLPSLWIGNQSRVAAHADLPQNLAVVVTGRRRFTLFPPEQLANLYIGPMDASPAGRAISLVDFTKPDFAQFPKFAEAMTHAQVVELEPGDALIIPSMWWHHVEALSPLNVLMNFWWRDSPSYLPSPQLALQLAMLSINALPEEQKAAWRAHFEHYVFGHGNAGHIPEHLRGLQGLLTEPLARQVRAELLNKLNR
ncbi:cupin-like domain-containing protein [Alkalimonas sp.]|uniref:cupin-like domain-containing protein n=1 Tax=Alkalimonas sp. TaxID=1872453 RepID=UPI00263A65B2|nr:cupin-like domain-containing protein [Alkalimonas sp.]MCC5826642.1 cupin-like domain-containing protein [Alkalimonas sp.]